MQLSSQEGFSTSTVESLSWLPVTALLTLKFGYGLAFSTMGGLFTGEMFPPEIKETSAAILSSSSFLIGFLLSKFQSQLEDAVGVYQIFYVYSGIGAIATLFALLAVPETLGKTPAQMRDYFEEHSYCWKRSN